MSKLKAKQMKAGAFSDTIKSLWLRCVLSVTNTKGFVVQTEHFDKSVASADISNYKIVKKGQFGFNPSRVNVGSFDALEQIKIFASSINEQKRIADTLSDIDQEITLLENKRNALKKQKKGLMQKLLTGKILVKDGAK